MPPIPAGLDALSPALAALVKSFRVDPDALVVAAKLSQASPPVRIPIAGILEKLPVTKMRALLERVAEGGGAGVMAELNRLTYPRAESPVGQAMRCIDFAARVLEIRDLRLKKEAEAAAAKRQREAEQRKQHLASIRQGADTIWSGLDPLMAQKSSSAYDQASAQLQQLRDAYSQAGEISGFQQKLAGFRKRYSNRPGMLRRIEKL